VDKKTPIINILTYGLPYKLANQIYNEYQERTKDAKYIIGISERYFKLKDSINTVELLLALSIFHKRVISNLDGAVKFYKTIGEYSESEIIAIGSYDLTFEEKNKILALLINYRKLIEKFGLTDEMMDYYSTKDFLIKILYLKSRFENGNYEENDGSDGKESNGGKFKNSEEKDDLPF
jgi:hypothetical protein